MALTIKDFGIGRNHAVTRTHLSLKTGLNDREVRAEIKRLRDEGNIILSSPASSGYWIPDNYEELNEYIETMESYAKSCMKSATFARQLLKQRDQMGLGLV